MGSNPVYQAMHGSAPHTVHSCDRLLHMCCNTAGSHGQPRTGDAKCVGGWVGAGVTVIQMRTTCGCGWVWDAARLSLPWLHARGYIHQEAHATALVAHACTLCDLSHATLHAILCSTYCCPCGSDQANICTITARYQVMSEAASPSKQHRTLPLRPCASTHPFLFM